MKKIFYHIFFLSLYWLHAQEIELIKHRVEPGETIYSIARKYHVTPYKIIKNNPGLGEKIKPGQILLIPTESRSDTTLSDARYVGFKYHTVQENETVFSISKKYNTTIEDIIKVNKLDNNNIKLGQIIIIPILYDPYAKIDTARFTIYIVKPKEGKWRVAYNHGISVEELERLNPEIKNKPLQVNQRLIVPKNKAETGRQEDKNYVFYEVKPLETLFSLSKRFDISQEELIRHNPELTDGLKAGQILKIPKKKKEIETDSPADGKYIYHQVKPKETIYRITKRYNISVEELMKLNPRLKEGLKAGMTLRIPRPAFQIVFDINSPLFFRVEKLLSPRESTVNLLENINKQKTYKFAVLLPLKVDKFDRNAENPCHDPVLRSKVLDYYAGIRTAVDSLKNMGVRVDFDLYDTQGSAYVTDQILMNVDLSDYDFVLGPLYNNNVQKTLEALMNFNTPVVTPSFKSVSVYPNLVQTATDSMAMAQHVLDYIGQIRQHDNIIVVGDEQSRQVADQVAAELGSYNKLIAKSGKKGNWIKPDDLRRLLISGKKNIIVIATDDMSLFANILSISEGWTSQYNIEMYALEYFKKLEQFDIKKMAAVNFHFPSRSNLIPDARLVRYVKNKYDLFPTQAHINGFDTVFDLILRLGNANNLFDGLKKYGKTKESSYVFMYGFNPQTGFKNIASYIFRINQYLEPEQVD